MPNYSTPEVVLVALPIFGFDEREFEAFVWDL